MFPTAARRTKTGSFGPNAPNLRRRPHTVESADGLMNWTGTIWNLLAMASKRQERCPSKALALLPGRRLLRRVALGRAQRGTVADVVDGSQRTGAASAPGRRG